MRLNAPPGSQPSLLGVVSASVVEPGEKAVIVSRPQCVFRPDRFYVPEPCAAFMILSSSADNGLSGGPKTLIVEASAREFCQPEQTAAALGTAFLRAEGQPNDADFNAGTRDLPGPVPAIGVALVAKQRTITPAGWITTTVRNDGPVALPFVGAYLGLAIE